MKQWMATAVMVGCIFLMACGNTNARTTAVLDTATNNHQIKQSKMTIEIWSDVVCPFCYIGKRHFEKALEQLPFKDQIQVVWKSFQLSPEESKTPGNNQYIDNLSQKKGWSSQQVRQILAQVTETAKVAGLDYQLNGAYVVNTFAAHKIIQLAKDHQRGDVAEERFFKAYFTEQKDLNDTQVLLTLAQEIGLEKALAEAALHSDAYQKKVEADIAEAQQLGIRSVPFFVMNRQYGVNGAQPVEAFVQTLEKAFQEWQSSQGGTTFQVQEGATCQPNGDCD